MPRAVAIELARLWAENARLLRLLELTPGQAALPRPSQSGFFEAQPGPVHAGSSPEEKVAFFGALFAARADLYALRYDNRRTSKAGWIPATRGGFHRRVSHSERDYLPLTAEVLAAHLSGKTHIGLYPLLDGDNCWWLAADFDGPDAMIEALMYLKAARALQVPAARIHQPRLPRPPADHANTKRLHPPKLSHALRPPSVAACLGHRLPGT